MSIASFGGTLLAEVKQGTIFDLQRTASNELEVVSVGFWDRLALRIFPCLRRDHDVRLATILADYLAEMPRLLIPEADKSPLVQGVRLLRKQWSVTNSKDPGVQKFYREFLAAKLGVSSAVFEANPGFQAFAQKTYLERYLMYYGDELYVNPVNQEVHLKKDGVLVRWNAIQAEVQAWGGRAEKPSWFWPYGPEGLQNKDFYDWKHLRHDKIDDPAKWGNQYIKDIAIICGNDLAQTSGAHSWICLRTGPLRELNGKGYVYNVGYYRDGPWDRQPLTVKHAHLQNPDVSIVWDGNIFYLRKAITKEDFHHEKARIEALKAQEPLVFQVNASNCITFSKAGSNSAAFDLPTKIPLTSILPPSVLSLAGRASKYLSECVVNIANKILVLIANVAQLCMGAWRVEQKVIDHHGDGIQPYISSLDDLLDDDKATFQPPAYVAHHLIPKIEAWREAEIQKIERQNPPNKESLIHSIKYVLPTY